MTFETCVQYTGCCPDGRRASSANEVEERTTRKAAASQTEISLSLSSHDDEERRAQDEACKR